MADEKVIIGIELDDKDTAKVSQNLKETFSKGGAEAGKTFGSSFSDSSSSFIGKLSNSLFSIKGLIAGIGTAVAGAFAIGKFVDASKQSEDAIRRLNTSLQLTGQYSEKTSSSIQSYAGELQKLTRYEDDALIANAALIQSLGKLDEEGLKRALKSTTDLASGLGIDLESATQLVAKAAGGNVAAFTRYGIAIEKGTTSSQTFANALKKIEDSFGGAAASNVQTYSGRVDRLTNAQGDLAEELGGIITKSPAVREVIRQMTVSVVDFTEKVKAFAASQDFVDLQRKIIDVSITLTKYLGGGFEITINIIKSLFDGLRVAIDGALLWIVTAYAKAFGFIADSIPDFLKDKFTGLEQFRTDLDNLSSGQLTTFNETVAATNENLANLFSTEYTEGITERLALVRDSLDETSAKMKNLAVVSDNSEKSIKQDSFDIAQSIRQVLAGAIATGIQAITQSLIKGTFSFKDFTKQVLVVVGDMAIQLGKTAILTGIAMESLGKLSGTGAIIAGAGLIALGTILKSYAGGGEGASAGGGGGGGNFDFAGTTPEQTSFTQFQKEEEKTAVTVNIQGDVLDSEETGIKIVDLINQASSNSNVTINRRAFA